MAFKILIFLLAQHSLATVIGKDFPQKNVFFIYSEKPNIPEKTSVKMDFCNERKEGSKRSHLLHDSCRQMESNHQGPCGFPLPTTTGAAECSDHPITPGVTTIQTTSQCLTWPTTRCPTPAASFPPMNMTPPTVLVPSLSHSVIVTTNLTCVKIIPTTTPLNTACSGIALTTGMMSVIPNSSVCTVPTGGSTRLPPIGATLFSNAATCMTSTAYNIPSVSTGCSSLSTKNASTTSQICPSIAITNISTPILLSTTISIPATSMVPTVANKSTSAICNTLIPSTTISTTACLHTAPTQSFFAFLALRNTILPRIGKTAKSSQTIETGYIGKVKTYLEKTVDRSTNSLLQKSNGCGCSTMGNTCGISSTSTTTACHKSTTHTTSQTCLTCPPLTTRCSTKSTTPCAATTKHTPCATTTSTRTACPSTTTMHCSVHTTTCQQTTPPCGSGDMSSIIEDNPSQLLPKFWL